MEPGYTIQAKEDALKKCNSTAPNTNRESAQSTMINSLVERCRTQPPADLQMSLQQQRSSPEQYRSGTALDDDSILEQSYPGSMNNLYEAISKVLKKHEQQIISSTYSKMCKELSTRTSQLYSSAELTEELSKSLLRVTHQRVGSMIQYACVSDKPGYDELETENLIQYMVLSETNIRSQVEKKKLIYVSNYLFDRYEEHRTKLKEILDSIQKPQSDRQKSNQRATSKNLEATNKIIQQLRETDEKNRKHIIELREEVTLLKEREDSKNSIIQNLQQICSKIREQYKKSLGDKSSEIQSLNKSIGMLQTENKSLKQEIVNHSLQVIELKERLDKANQQNSKLSQINSEILAKYVEKVSKSVPQIDFEKQRNESLTIQHQNSILNRQIHDMAMEFQSLKRKLNEKADEQTQRVNKQNAEMLIRSVTYKARVEALQNQKIALEADLERQKERSSKYQKDAEQSEQTSQSRLGVLNRDITELRRERLNNQSQIQMLQRRLYQREMELGELHISSEEKEEELNKIKKENQIYSENVNLSILENGNLKIELARLQQEIVCLNQSYNQLVKQSTNSLNLLKQNRSTLQKKNKEWKLLAESEKFKLQMSEQQSELNKEQIRSLNQEVVSLRQSNIEYQTKINQLENDYEQVSEETERQNAKTKEQFEKLILSYKKLETEFKQTKQQKDILAGKLKETQKNLQSAQVKLVKIDSLENALHKTQQYAEEMYCRLEEKDKLIAQLNSNVKEVTMEGSLISMEQFDAEYIQKKVVVNFLLNFLNQETPASNRLNAILTMAEALKMSSNDAKSIVASSQKWFMHQIIRKQQETAAEQTPLESEPIYQKFYTFLNDSQ